MTDNEIIKALECCSHRIGNLQCEHCPAYSIAQMCIEDLMSDALDLINRQKAEIERLEQNINGIDIVSRNHIKAIRTQAIKEFAERLKQSAFDCDVSFGYGKEHYTKSVAVIEIDNLVKEMTEVEE